MRTCVSKILFIAVIVAGCQSEPLTYDDSDILDNKSRRDKDLGQLFGDDLFTFGGKSNNAQATTGITVNEFLWRAALDTVSFMPLRSVDPFGGVILTEWYMPESAKNERLKLDVFILDKNLSANGVRVAVHKQVFDARTKQWADSTIDAKTVNDLEESILTKARQLKVGSKF
ncbi:MAG: DUF3576 domain-containing protein [Alphaproteobacteria bacterium]|nr:DUF3576 domain-containing protein [Alphaproteobacteria bacterium]